MSRPVEVRLLEALIPPPDFGLVCLVGTTYSLNPAVFLAIISAASFDWFSRGGSVGFDTLTKEEWRSLLIDKRRDCLMFVDHHGPLEISSGGLRPLETVVLDRVIKRHGRDTGEGGSLHSKLVVALYRNSRNSLMGRVYLGSKNFTSSNMEEFGVIYDLWPSSRSVRNRSFVDSLIGYLEYLRNREAVGTEQSRLQPLSLSIDLLRNERLCLAEDGCDFHWQGRGKWATEQKCLAEQLESLVRRNWDGIFVHSPWTRQAAVRFLADPRKNVPIHISCLKEPGLSTLKQKNVRYQLSYSASGLVQPYQSHAKVYLFSRQADSVLLFGSANLTPDGWGIQNPGCRPNAEILVSTQVRASDYRYLTDIGGNPEGISPSKGEPSLQERVLALLNSIDVQVSYDRKASELRYEIRLRGGLDGFKDKVTIAHELIEPSEGETTTSVTVCHGWPLPSDANVAWPRSELFQVSSLVRISCPAHHVDTHLIVDLDSEFYEGRAKLRALQYRAKELLESLAELMNVVIPPAPPRGDGSGESHQAQLAALLDGLRIERYAYKMARLKTREPSTFQRTIERVTKLLTAAMKDESLSKAPRFRALADAIETIHGELARA